MNSDISQRWCLGRWAEWPGKPWARVVSWKPETESFTEDRGVFQVQCCQKVGFEKDWELSFGFHTLEVITGLGKRDFGEMVGEKCPIGERRIDFNESV